jgi:hypothetical protein
MIVNCFAWTAAGRSATVTENSRSPIPVFARESRHLVVDDAGQFEAHALIDVIIFEGDAALLALETIEIACRSDDGAAF